MTRLAIAVPLPFGSNANRAITGSYGLTLHFECGVHANYLDEADEHALRELGLETPISGWLSDDDLARLVTHLVKAGHFTVLVEDPAHWRLPTPTEETTE